METSIAATKIFSIVSFSLLLRKENGIRDMGGGRRLHEAVTIESMQKFREDAKLSSANSDRKTGQHPNHKTSRMLGGRIIIAKHKVASRLAGRIRQIGRRLSKLSLAGIPGIKIEVEYKNISISKDTRSVPVNY